MLTTFKPAIVSLTHVIVLFAVTCGDAESALITRPSELMPGDEYRLVFVTSTTIAATETDINAYDLHVASAANSVPALQSLGINWRAIGSTDGLEARQHTDTVPSTVGGTIGVPIYSVDGVLVAQNNDDFWDGNILHPINYTEQDTLLSGSVWTGTMSSGIAHNSMFLGAASKVRFGLTTDTNASWISFPNGSTARTLGRSMYGISDTLTVHTPEPSSLRLGMLLITGILLIRQTKIRSVRSAA